MRKFLFLCVILSFFIVGLGTRIGSSLPEAFEEPRKLAGKIYDPYIVDIVLGNSIEIKEVIETARGEKS